MNSAIVMYTRILLVLSAAAGVGWAIATSMPGQIPVIVAALASLLSLLRIEEVHEGVNSKVQQLIDTTAKASHAEGVLEEKIRVEEPKSPTNEAKDP